MVDVKFAITAARDYIKEFQALLDNPLENLRLEEVERTEDRKYWLITLGYDDPDGLKHLPDFLTPSTQLSSREYKLFRVNSDSGEVESMKIRKV
ncbi:MAG: hypothetical protein WA949_23885 [Phormidesmis sp.]